ncbi:HIT domain-containing protein [Candidatus Peregrinibacteria bacterium]|nr:HIT domain-containing protein [Candidatus Peregrinibacteria bacterium]
MNSQCQFCKIIAGKAPASVVFENENLIAFSPLKEVSPGHTLLIPKRHFKDIFEMDEETMALLGVAAKELSELLTLKNSATGINILHASGKDAQQSVFHFHLHIVPRYPSDNLDLWLKIDPIN